MHFGFFLHFFPTDVHATPKTPSSPNQDAKYSRYHTKEKRRVFEKDRTSVLASAGLTLLRACRSKGMNEKFPKFTEQTAYLPELTWSDHQVHTLVGGCVTAVLSPRRWRETSGGPATVSTPFLQLQGLSPALGIFSCQAGSSIFSFKELL